MDIKKWASIFLTTVALYTASGVQELKAQTWEKLVFTMQELDAIPAAKLSPEQLQVVTLDQINKIRFSYDKAPLQIDTTLSKIAQDYANKQIFGHTPEDLKTRLENEWYIYLYASENLSDLSHAASATIPLAIQWQEESALHKKNLLNEKAWYVGMGFCEGILVVIFTNK